MKRIIILLSSLFFLNACSVIFGQQPRDLKIIEFDYEGHLEERKMAYDFFWREEGKYMPWIRFEHVGVGFFDLNHDGTKEIFAYINGQDMCPMVGCPVAIFKKRERCYQPLKWRGSAKVANIRNPSVHILESHHNDYHDVVFGNFIQDQQLIIWKWDGKTYCSTL